MITADATIKLRLHKLFHMACLLDRQKSEGHLMSENLFQGRISLPDLWVAVSWCIPKASGEFIQGSRWSPEQ